MKNKTISINVKIKSSNKEEKEAISNLFSFERIWDTEQIKEDMDAYIEDKKNMSKNNGDEEENDYLYSPKQTSTMDELYYLLKLMGFETVLKTNSLDEECIDGKNHRKNARPRDYIVAAHPSGILVDANSYFFNKDGSKRLNSIYVYSQTDLGMGIIGFLSSNIIENKGSSSGDFQKHGGFSRKSMASINNNLHEFINYLNSIQKASKIKKFDAWDEKEYISTIKPMDIISINEKTYPGITGEENIEIIKTVAKDTLDCMENALGENKKSDIGDKLKLFPGLGPTIKNCILNYANSYQPLSEQGDLIKEFRKEANKRGHISIDNNEVRIKNKDKRENNFHWLEFEEPLMELDKHASENYFRYLDDKDSQILGKWIDFIKKTIIEDEKKGVERFNKISKEEFIENGCYEKIIGGFDFPSFLMASTFKRTKINYNVNYNYLFERFLEKSSDEEIKDLCLTPNASGKTLPMQILDYLSRPEREFFTSLSNYNSANTLVDEFADKMIDILVERAGAKNISLSSKKHTSNGIWLANFVQAVKSNDKHVNYSDYKKIVEKFTSKGVGNDGDWRVFVPVDYNVDYLGNIEVLGSKQVVGGSLEDVIESFDEIKNSPETTKVILKEVIENISNENPRPKMSKRKI